MWFRIIKVEVGVISRAAVSLITLARRNNKTWIYCNCFIIHCFEENNHKHSSRGLWFDITLGNHALRSANATYKFVPKNSGALAREAEHHGNENLVNYPSEKIWLWRQRNPSVRTLFEGDGRESGVSSSGGGVCGSLSAAGHRVLCKCNK